MVIVMVGSFVVCYAPYAATAMWFANAEDSNKDYRLVAIPAFFSKSSCVYNPLIYAFMNKQVRWTTQPCWIITVHMQTNTNTLPFVYSSSMPASWRLYLARRLMRAQKFPARPKPLLYLHKLFYTPFTTFLDLFSFSLPPLVQIPNIYTLSRAEGVL